MIAASFPAPAFVGVRKSADVPFGSLQSRSAHECCRAWDPYIAACVAHNPSASRWPCCFWPDRRIIGRFRCRREREVCADEGSSCDWHAYGLVFAVCARFALVPFRSERMNETGLRFGVRCDNQFEREFITMTDSKAFHGYTWNS